MNVKTPTLRRHKDGRWYTSWGARYHFLGRDEVIARSRFAANLEDWARWRETRTRAHRCTNSVRPTLVVDIAEQFLTNKQDEGSRELADYYAKHLKRFLYGFGDHDAAAIRVSHVQSVKTEMLRAKYKPKTINHDIIAVKSMFQWAMDQELIPPVNLRGVKALPLGPPPDKSVPVSEVRAMVARADAPVYPWLAVNYLALCRPSEVVRVVHDEGKWVERGVFRLDRGKTAVKSNQPRHLVFSERALFFLSLCERVWSRLDSYSCAVRTACGPGGPGHLRHSAATHLMQAGVARADIDLCLGHMPPRVSLIYAQIIWQPLRKTTALLTL